MQDIAGKYAPDMVGESFSAGVGAFIDYAKKAENFKAEDAAVAFASGSTLGFLKSCMTTGAKVGLSKKIDIKKHPYLGPTKQALINDAASRGAGIIYDPMDKAVQRGLLNDSARTPKAYSQEELVNLYVKDVQEADAGTVKSNLKSAAGDPKARVDKWKEARKSDAQSGTVEGAHK